VSASRWLNWTPHRPIIAKLPESNPTKPTEPPFVGFVGSSSANSQIIGSEVSAAVSPVVAPASSPTHPAKHLQDQPSVSQHELAALAKANERKFGRGKRSRLLGYIGTRVNTPDGAGVLVDVKELCSVDLRDIGEYGQRRVRRYPPEDVEPLP
jgi:hypothetical protein